MLLTYIENAAENSSAIMVTLRIDHLKDFRFAEIIFFQAVKENEDWTHVMKTALGNKDNMNVTKTVCT